MLRPDPWHYRFHRSLQKRNAAGTRPRTPFETRRAIRLRGPWDLLGLMLPTLGPVKIVHGDKVSDQGPSPTLADTEARTFDPRTDAQPWQQGYALIEEQFGLTLCSLRLLAVDGSRQLELHLTDQSNRLAWSKLLCCFRDPVPSGMA